MHTRIVTTPGIHVTQYTIVLSKPGHPFCYERRILCDACRATRPNASAEGEVINGYCDGCGAGPSVSRYRSAPVRPAAPEREIKYDPKSRDFACFLNGELVCYARTFHEGEVTLDELVLNILATEAN